MNEEGKSGINKKQLLIIVIIAAVAAAAAVSLILLLPKPEEEIPTFAIWHSYPEGSGEAEYIEKTIIPILESQFTGIKVSAEYYDEKGIYDQVLRAKNEGKSPDVVFLTKEAMAGLAQIGVLEILSGGDEDTDFSMFIETLSDEPVSAGMIGGKAYGLPMEVSVQVLLYNPAIVSSAGVTPPASIDAFWSALETFSSGDIATAGFILPDAGMKNLAPFVWSTGGEMVNAEGTRAYGYLNDVKNIDIFDRFAAALESGQIIVADSEDNSLALFASGKAAMTLIDTTMLPDFSEKYPGAVFEVTAFPKGSGGSVSVLDCKFVSVTKDARKDMATVALSEIMSADAMKTESSSYIPEGSLASARFLPMSYSMKDMQNEFLLAMKQITEGYKDTEEALDDLALKWDAYLP
jgi:ABC-type glycerol-3-phosphate transport system substrate-binding protein